MYIPSAAITDVARKVYASFSNERLSPTLALMAIM